MNDKKNLKKCFETENLYFDVLCFDTVDLDNVVDIFLSSNREGVFEDMFLEFRHHKDVFNYVQKEAIKRKNKKGGTYMLRKKSDDVIVGAVSYNNIDSNKVTLGIWIRKQFWGKGYCKESVNKAIEILFQRGNSEIEIATLVNNERAYQVFSSIVDENGGFYRGLDKNYDKAPEEVSAHVFIISQN